MSEGKKRVKTKLTVPDETFTRDPDSGEETMFEFIARRVKESFVGNIPMESVKELPDQTYVYTFGMLSYAIALTCLVYFSYTGYQEARSKSFVALDRSDGVCVAVPKTIGGQYMGSHGGVWEGAVGFDETEAMYTLHLDNFRHDMKRYKKYMRHVNSELQKVGEGAVNRTAAENLLYWMTWQTDLITATDENHKLEMTGDAVSIFRREFFFGVLAGLGGECPLNGTSELKPADAIFELTFPKDQFDDQALCTSALIPEYAGYKLKYSKNDFRLAFDIQSAMVALGVNSGILPQEKLGYISNTSTTIQFNDTIVTVTQNIDVRYPGMLPITCLNYSLQFVCTVKVGGMYFLPVLNHFGLGPDEPNPCDCSRGDGDNPDCNVFDNMVSFLFYNQPDFDVVGDSQFTNLHGILLLAASDSMFNLNRKAFNISFAAAQYGIWTDPDWRSQAYRFCTFPGLGSCSIVMFNPYDEISNTVSKYYYQVPGAACSDSFTTEQWSKLQNTPPEELDEKYLECVLPWYSAIFASVGIASGNAALAVPIIMFLALPILYLYMQLSGRVPPKEEYTTDELDAASRAHALFILRVRDSKLRGITPNGAIYQVAKELIASAKMEGGFPDSDDDSDEDDTQDEELEVIENAPKRRTSILISAAARKRASTTNLKRTSRRRSGSGAKEVKSALQLIPLRVNRPQTHQGLVILNNFKKKDPTWTSGVKAVTKAGVEELLNNLKSSLLKAMETRDVDGGSAVFKVARESTYPLTNVDLDLVVATCEPSDIVHMFVKLHEIIVLHTSLELGIKMSDVERDYEKSVCYNIGGRLLTAYDIHQLADGCVSSPLSVGIEK